MTRIKRSNAIYLEIESFSDYELINCVAFEMAIRVKEVQYYLYEAEQHLSQNFPANDEYFSEFKKIISKLSFYGLHPITIQPREKHFSINLEYRNEGAYYSYKPTSIFYNHGDGKYEKITGVSHTINAVDNNFIKTVNQKNAKFTKVIISSFISRTRLEFEFYNEPQIQLNFNLPKEELIAYIAKIKDEFDKDKTMIRTPLEIIGENITRTKKTLHINKTTKYADMFFIYDAYKEKMKQKDIMQILNDYHYDKYKKISNFDNKTIKKYYSIAIDYIDNLRYKELITGIQNRNF